MVRRTRGPWPAAQAEGDRRQSRREPTSVSALLRAGDLTLEGRLGDVSAGGAFLATHLLIEVGELGVLEAGGVSVAVEVVWLRGHTHAGGPGMGLLFQGDPEEGARFHRRFVPG